MRFQHAGADPVRLHVPGILRGGNSPQKGFVITHLLVGIEDDGLLNRTAVWISMIQRPLNITLNPWPKNSAKHRTAIVSAHPCEPQAKAIGHASLVASVGAGKLG